MPVNHANEFLKSVHTEALFQELFSRNFEQLFPSCETFFQKMFWFKSLQMVKTCVWKTDNLKSTLMNVPTRRI